MYELSTQLKQQSCKAAFGVLNSFNLDTFFVDRRSELANEKSQSDSAGSSASDDTTSDVVTQKCESKDRDLSDLLEFVIEKPLPKSSLTKASKKSRKKAKRKSRKFNAKQLKRALKSMFYEDEKALQAAKEPESSFHDALNDSSELWENLLDDESLKLLPLAFEGDLAGERRKLASMIETFQQLDAAMAEAQASQKTHGSLTGFVDVQKSESESVVTTSKNARKSVSTSKRSKDKT